MSRPGTSNTLGGRTSQYSWATRILLPLKCLLRTKGTDDRIGVSDSTRNNQTDIPKLYKPKSLSASEPISILPEREARASGDKRRRRELYT